VFFDVAHAGLRLGRSSGFDHDYYTVMLALRDAGISRAELARRLKWKRESVDRLFRLDHRSRLEQIEAALAVLGRKADIKVRDAA
jgi:ribosome-binding protein aMBF1 (putative translation factor)